MENQDNYCENCNRNITVNFELHMIHCKKNFKLCSLCKEPVLFNEFKEHLESMHIIELCDFCRKPFQKWELEKHQSDCPKKPLVCKFCNLDVAADCFKEHAEMCWNKTEKCSSCGQYVKRKDMECHEKTCKSDGPKKPLVCKFCNLDVAADSFKEHAEMCWNRTEKCSSCGQYVKLKDMECHEKACKNSSMMGMMGTAYCTFCKEPYPLHVIDTHESSCGEKTTRCPDCGELIKKYHNNHVCKAMKDSDSMSIVRCISCDKKYPRSLLATHIKDCHVNTNNRNSSSVSVRSGKANGHDKNREVSSRPFNDNQHLPNSFQREPRRNQAVELSPPVQKDLSDLKLNRTFKDENSMIQCKLCSQYLIPQESRIHPEICPLRSTLCKLCENYVPFNILQPELHRCQNKFMPSGYHKSVSSAMAGELGMQEKYTAECSSSSNLSWETSKIQTKDCPLCSVNFPLDRFDDHVRACAKGKKFCNICKNDYFGDTKEHLAKCSGRESKKGKKKNEEKNDGFFTNLLKKGKKAYSSVKYPEEKPQIIDGIPCEFCKEIYPFAEIAVHELGCLHEISQAEERMKKSVSTKKPKDDVPQACGYTPFDPSQYMITDSYEHNDREPRNKRFAEKSGKDVSSKFSYSEPNQGIGNSLNHQSDVYNNDFYNKHKIKDHEREISAGQSQKGREPRKAVEEGKKREDVIFTYSSAAKNKFSAQENKLEQGARPKYQSREYLSKIYSSHKGLNNFSDSDEEIGSGQNKEKNMNLENNQGLSSTVYTNELHHKLSAIGSSEQEQKKSSIESKNNNSCILNENSAIPKSSSPDASSYVTNKKESFNSDTSEEVYLSCDEGEEISEARPFNNDVKTLMNVVSDDKNLDNYSIEKRSLSNEENVLQKQNITLIDFDKYSKGDKDASILQNEEMEDRNCNSEKRSLPGKADRMQRHEISMYDLEKYSKEKKNDNNHLKNIDSITSNSSIFSHKEKHSLLPKYVMDINDIESNATRKNEEMFASESLGSLNDFEKYIKEKQKYGNHLKDIDSIRSNSSFISKYVMDIDDIESEADRKNEETFASESRIDKNPFDSMTNSQFSYEAVSSLPPYSSFDSDCSNHGGVDAKNDDNFDAYLQFLGMTDPEPDANYKLFESTHGSKSLDPDLSYGCLKNDELGANNTFAHGPKQTSVPQEPSVQMEELKGVSKNMPSYTSPFLLENECEEEELVLNTRSFPVPLQEAGIGEIGDKSRIDVKLQSREEKDNEHNLKIWGTWRSPRQDDSDE